MTIIDVPQRSPEWFAARLGRLTASRASDMLAIGKAGRKNLTAQLVCERLTGQPQEDAFVSAAMQRGMDCEPQAFAAYEAVTGNVARTVGFIQHDALLVGCSPDGLVDDDGVLELKCPNSATHLEYLKARTVPDKYLPQLLHTLWVTERAYCDFVSFDDRFPSALQVFHVRMTRDDKAIAIYAKAAQAFLQDVDNEVLSLLGDKVA